MNAPGRILLVSLTISLPFALGACGSQQAVVIEPLPPAAPQVVAEEGPGGHWIGHSSKEVIAKYGPPDLLLETSPIASSYTGTATFVSYVYRSSGTGYGCNEAFVVDRSTSMIVDYHCH